jgi:hypothetical protein
MQRQLVTAVAVAVTIAVAATALLVQLTAATDAREERPVAAQRPGLVPPHLHAPGTPPHRHAPGTAPLPGPGTAAVPAGKSLALAGGRARVLRPDMFSLRARDLQMSGTPRRRVLRFAAMLANRGPGPMLLRPRPRLHCRAGERHARQLLYVDRNNDGRFQRGRDTGVRSRSAGCMLDHPTHGHWHFDAMASYRLVDPRPRVRVVSGRPKVSFCLRDNQPIPGTRPRQARAYYGECGRHRVQGVSPGWVDLYDVNTPGQSVRVPRRARGLHCLVLRADPKRLLLETNERNNARALPVRIRGMRVTTPRTSACRGVVRR